MRKFLRIALLAISVMTVAATDAQAEFQYRFKVPGVKATASVGVPGETSPPSQGPLGSCKDILDADGSAISGVHEIDVGGQALNVYCDMDHAGGGWTLVVAQYDDNPLYNWDQGVSEGYDPTPEDGGQSFALSQTQLPTHSETAFGQGDDATAFDYGTFTYTTGDISLTTMTGQKLDSYTGQAVVYHVYRLAINGYGGSDPDTYGLGVTAKYYNALVVNATPNDAWGSLGGTGRWVFMPSTSLGIPERGNSLNGMLYSTVEPYAWTVWVR